MFAHIKVHRARQENNKENRSLFYINTLLVLYYDILHGESVATQSANFS